MGTYQAKIFLLGGEGVWVRMGTHGTYSRHVCIRKMVNLNGLPRIPTLTVTYRVEDGEKFCRRHEQVVLCKYKWQVAVSVYIIVSDQNQE